MCSGEYCCLWCFVAFAGLPLIDTTFYAICNFRSPTHPSLFATASSTGSIGLWNLASSLEEPITGGDGIVVETEAATTGKRGLNKLKWSADGRRIMVAAGDHVHVLSLSEDVVRQKGDEDSRVMSHLVSRGLLERE
jgi:dynein intermediate chain, cytosolic